MIILNLPTHYHITRYSFYYANWVTASQISESIQTNKIALLSAGNLAAAVLSLKKGKTTQKYSLMIRKSSYLSTYPNTMLYRCIETPWVWILRCIFNVAAWGHEVYEVGFCLWRQSACRPWSILYHRSYPLT